MDGVTMDGYELAVGWLAEISGWKVREPVEWTPAVRYEGTVADLVDRLVEQEQESSGHGLWASERRRTRGTGLRGLAGRLVEVDEVEAPTIRETLRAMSNDRDVWRWEPAVSLSPLADELSVLGDLKRIRELEAIEARIAEELSEAWGRWAGPDATEWEWAWKT